ncbi:hypothetical protein [Nocardioides sp. KR10-350]|uniref:hypothetical protein n=1 Tax=Nocardioides cheoyonin TaxID=3156615 RepID=UPI0032B39679
MCDASKHGAGSRGGTTTLKDASGRRCPACVARAEREALEEVRDASGKIIEMHWLGFKRDANGQKVLDEHGEPILERLTASNSIGGPVREVEAWFVNEDGHPRHIDDPDYERRAVRPEGFLSTTVDASRKSRQRYGKLFESADSMRTREGVAPGQRLDQAAKDALWAERNPLAGSLPSAKTLAGIQAAQTIERSAAAAGLSTEAFVAKYRRVLPRPSDPYSAEQHYAAAFGGKPSSTITSRGVVKDLGFVKMAETEVTIHGKPNKRLVVATFPGGPEHGSYRGGLGPGRKNPPAALAAPTLYGGTHENADAATDIMDRIEALEAADQTVADRLDTHLRIADEERAVREAPTVAGYDPGEVSGSNTGYGGTGTTGTHGKVRDSETVSRGGSHLLGGIPASEALSDPGQGQAAFDAITAAINAGQTPTQEEINFWSNYTLGEVTYA